MFLSESKYSFNNEKNTGFPGLQKDITVVIVEKIHFP